MDLQRRRDDRHARPALSIGNGIGEHVAHHCVALRRRRRCLQPRRAPRRGRPASRYRPQPSRQALERRLEGLRPASNLPRSSGGMPNARARSHRLGVGHSGSGRPSCDRAGRRRAGKEPQIGAELDGPRPAPQARGARVRTACADRADGQGGADDFADRGQIGLRQRPVFAHAHLTNRTGHVVADSATARSIRRASIAVSVVRLRR